jgi:cell division protein FtsW
MSSRRFTAEKLEKKPVDLSFLTVILVFIGLGISMLFSSSYFRAERLFGDPLYFVKWHGIWLLLGSVSALIISRVSLTLLKENIPFILLVSIVLLILTFIPGISLQVQGARRWIYIAGQSFQPSELAKLSLVIYLAYILDKKADKMDDPLNSLLPPFIIVALFAGLIYLQNDFSTAFFILVIGAVMFFIARVKLRYFLALGIMSLPLTLILLLNREHRVKRIMAFLEPELDPAGTGYQIIASETALRKGGLWGEGLGKGVTKFGSLPEAHSDFVFAVFGEETGFIGICCVVLLYVVFAFKGYMIARRQTDRFKAYFAFGLTSCIFFQALLNMAVVSGLIPATGIPLPFFSSGGSAAFITLIMCGFLLNISRYDESRTADG